jgi:hypothetical protein
MAFSNLQMGWLKLATLYSLEQRAIATWGSSQIALDAARNWPVSLVFVHIVK